MMTGNWIEAKCQKFNKSHGIVKGIQNITLTAPKTQKEQKLFTFENDFNSKNQKQQPEEIERE